MPSVRSAQISDRDGEPVLDIGYIRIQQFTPRTVEEVRELLDAAETSGIVKLIIDLRNNPGGLVSATVDTTGLFMDQGVVMRQVNRSGGERTYEDSAGGAGLDFEIAILINEGSASGSEVMAAALRDHGRAVLIGQTTIGKGTVNIERPLSDGSVLYVSIARWLSPDREVIEGVGVAPDIEVVQPEGGLAADNDLALPRSDRTTCAAAPARAARQRRTAMTTNSGWARPELICSTEELADQLGDPDLVLLDCDLLPAYQRLHLPGAIWSQSRYWKSDPLQRLRDLRARGPGALRLALAGGWGSRRKAGSSPTTAPAGSTPPAPGGPSTASATPTSKYSTAASTSGTRPAAS